MKGIGVYYIVNVFPWKPLDTIKQTTTNFSTLGNQTRDELRGGGYVCFQHHDCSSNTTM